MTGSSRRAVLLLALLFSAALGLAAPGAFSAGGTASVALATLAARPLAAPNPPPIAWEFIGPRGVQPPVRPGFGTGWVSGRVNAAAFSPSNSNTIYVGAPGGGVWKSTDRGVNWECMSDGHDDVDPAKDQQQWPHLTVSSIAINPQDERVIYVGTGDANGGNDVFGYGIQKSTDAGLTWQTVGAGSFGGSAPRAILVDPENPQILVVPVAGRVLRSTNGGGSFTPVLTPGGTNFTDGAISALDTGNTRYYFVVGESAGKGQVWRSADRGQSWTKLNPPLTQDVQFSLEVATSPSFPANVYLLSPADKKVFRSTNYGDAFVDTLFPLAANNGNWLAADYSYHITCSTRTDNGSDVLYVGMRDLFCSPDGGNTWNMSVGDTTGVTAEIHSYQHGMAINPRDPNDMLVYNDGGVYGMSFSPPATAWSFNTNLNRFLGITQFNKADFHPTDATRMIGGAEGAASVVALGDLDNWETRGAGYGGMSIINKGNPAEQFTTDQPLTIFETITQWTTSSQLSPNFGTDRFAQIGPIALDPTNTNLLYAGTNFLNRYNRGTGVWTMHLGNQELCTGGINSQEALTAIAVAPTDGNRIYTGATDGQVWMTVNGGTNWTQLNSGSPLPARPVSSITVDPTNPARVFITYRSRDTGRVFRCDDTNQPVRTWANITSNLSSFSFAGAVTSFSFFADVPQRCYFVSMEGGVFYTVNGGGNWLNATQPYRLPNTIVEDVEHVPGTNYVMAATHGRGMWRIQADALIPSIRGRVTIDGNPVDAVALTATLGAVFVDQVGSIGDGTYRIQGLAPNDYFVTPSKDGYAFSPAQRFVSVGPNAVSIDFQARPTPPTGLTATAVSQTRIDLTWTDTTPAETGFKIERTLDPAGMWTQVGQIDTPNATSFSDTTVSAETRYFYRVRAFTGATNGDPSVAANATTPPNPPIAPSPLTATTVSDRRVDLAWQNVAKETGYDVFRKQGMGGYSLLISLGADAVSHSDTTADPETSYTYKVVAFNTGGNSPDSNEATALTAPPAPTNLTAAQNGRTQINLTWVDTGAAESGFKIERRTGSDPFMQIDQVGPGVTSYPNTGLTPGTTYVYRVRAYNAGGNGPFSNEASDTTIPNPPTDPSGLTATPISSTQMRLNWNDNSNNEQGFTIERRSGSDPFQIVGSAPADAREAVDGNLTPETTYVYRIQAVNAGGPSGYSEALPATTLPNPPAAPSQLVAFTISTSRIDLFWVDNSTNETGFRIDRKTGQEAFQEIGSAIVARFSDDTLVPGTNYVYRVRAINAGGSSAPSNEANATTLPVPPLKPSGLQAMARSSSQIDLVWKDESNNEQGFKIERKVGNESFADLYRAPANATSFSVTDLQPVTTYTFRVRAYNLSGDSDYSDEASATTLPVPPTAPSGLSVSLTNGTTAQLAWSDTSDNETGFRIERADGGGRFTLIATLGANVTSHTDGGLALDREYAYRVQAFNTGGDSAFGNEARVTTPPVPPSGLSVVSTTDSKVELSWTDESVTETSFQVERRGPASQPDAPFEVVGTVGANTRLFADSGLAPNSTYTYRVQAVNGGGGSGFSNSVDATTRPLNPGQVATPTAPSGLTATLATQSSIRLDWRDNSSDETGFKIERSTGGAEFTQIGTASANAETFTDSDLQPGTTFTYRLRAANAGGDSAYTDTASATTPPAAPAAPSGLSAALRGTGVAVLEWTDNSTDETEFKVERQSGDSEFVQIGGVGANVTRFEDTDLSEGVTYVYRVRASNSGGDSGYSNTASVTRGVDPRVLIALRLRPARLRGGLTSLGTVVLNRPVLTDTTVRINAPRNRFTTVPQSVTVLAGTDTGTFEISTRPVTRNQQVRITAILNGSRKPAILTVTGRRAPRPRRPRGR